MTHLELFSEPFARTGNIAADGFRKLLGCPAQDLLQTVLRESIQNSIDAGRLGSGPSIHIRYRTLRPEQQAFLRKHVLSERILCDQTEKNVLNSIAKPDLKVFEICDFNTTGLGGPTSGDAAAEGEETLDFVNFLRNVGVTRDTHHGGGTYGYGKTSLYAMSACSSILVDTQTTDSNLPVRRFMGCHLGSAFDAVAPDGKRKRFTGRHWWGLKDGEGGIDPVTGETAATLSSSLGMPSRGDGQTGTTVMILDPHIDDEARPPEHEMIETILWNFWPRLTATTPANRKLDIRLFIEDAEVALPTPEQFPPLDLFASAIAEHRKVDGEVIRIQRDKPHKLLGALAFKRGMRATRAGTALDEHTNVPLQASHIALMRPVELVVKYIYGDPFPDARYEWAGVFICSDEEAVEEAFAKAEPPAHDDWVPDMLPSGDSKSFVRVALKRLEHYAKNYAAPALSAVAATSAKGPSLAKTAAKLGNLLDASGTGPGKQSTQSARPSRKRNDLSISTPWFIRLEAGANNQPCAVFQAELHNDEADTRLKIVAESRLIADGGMTDNTDLPPGFESRVLKMELDATKRNAQGGVLDVGTESGTVTVWVLCPTDAAIGVRLAFVSGSEQ
jgi:hypothetical protein